MAVPDAVMTEAAGLRVMDPRVGTMKPRGSALQTVTKITQQFV
jgi:hypothetical protein